MYHSVYYPESAIRTLHSHCEPWAEAWKAQVVLAAEPWREMSDEALWGLVFGTRITRAWQVWSNGECPECRMPLPEYSWQIDALARAWKVRCPGCAAVFPTNDFAAYHRSGLDAAGWFDPARADRRLLFNADHPNPADPLHNYGVDDGEGWTDGVHRWRFIGAYLIYGQWKQLILGGITRCAAAYLATGEGAYAHTALLLLDRVADIYPQMDYRTQGLVYESAGHGGYVSVWHDACEEIAELALAYDAVRPALPAAEGLAAFLRTKDARKDSPEAIRANIEGHLLRHTLEHEQGIWSNFPRTDLAALRLHAILGDPCPEPRLHAMLDKATAVDGVTGEKGLNGYASWTSSGIFEFMAQLALTDEGRFRTVLAQHPGIHAGLRFYLDTWCLRRYYPSCGDAGAFTKPQEQYAALNFESYQVESQATPITPGFGRQFLPRPSPHLLLWAMYQATGDVDFLRLSRLANDSDDGQLRFGLLAEASPEVQTEYQHVLAEQGADIRQTSVDKPEWHLAILRAGQGVGERALWLDYDTGRNHHHFDGMNLGLFAYGLDLLPDFGYPPTGYGGHETREAMWYVHTAAHNTVVVDGKCQPGPHWTQEVLAAGHTDLWVNNGWTQGMRNDTPGVYAETSQYERTLWLTDIDDTAFYVLDIFRVVGGREHIKLTHSGRALLDTPGFHGTPTEHNIADALLRDLRVDPYPTCPWTADFHLQDPHNYRQQPGPVTLRVHDLTPDTEAGTLESWVNDGGYNDTSVLWIPTIISRRRAAQGELASTFVAVLEPFEGKSSIRAIRRAEIKTADGQILGPSHVALSVEHTDGRTDYYLMLNTGPHHGDGAEWRPGTTVYVPEWGLETDAEACALRRIPGMPEEVVLYRGAMGE
ncbi:MAG: heparinase II/III domain-containing protein [Armatimonadota bacterium]